MSQRNANCPICSLFWNLKFFRPLTCNYLRNTKNYYIHYQIDELNSRVLFVCLSSIVLRLFILLLSRPGMQLLTSWIFSQHFQDETCFFFFFRSKSWKFPDIFIKTIIQWWKKKKRKKKERKKRLNYDGQGCSNALFYWIFFRQQKNIFCLLNKSFCWLKSWKLQWLEIN